MSIPDIVQKVGCTAALVYNVKARMGDAPKRGPGRPPKARTSPSMGKVDGLAGIVAMVQNSERQRTQLRTALERIQAILADALR
jgi:hypothetical protein